VSLVSAFRCNPMVTALAANFLESESKQDEFRRQAKNAVGDRHRVGGLVSWGRPQA